MLSNQDNDIDKIELTIFDSVKIKRVLLLDNEVSKKRHIDDELDENTIPSCNRTPQNYLKISVEKTEYTLGKTNTGKKI